jgi:hypothetical protein
MESNVIDEIDPFMVDTIANKPDIFNSIEERPAVVDAALGYERAGLSVVPCKLPEKYPPLPWLTYQAERAAPDEIKQWYTRDPQWGLGLVCGEVSGGLEVIDLDGGSFAEQFDAAIRVNAPGLLEKLVIEQSPSGGRHYAYRCEEMMAMPRLPRRQRNYQVIGAAQMA